METESTVARPAGTPCTSATATARLRATTGVAKNESNWS
jgi:hypothetical protein